VFALVRHAEVGGGSGGGALGIERGTHQRATARRLVRTSAPRGRLHVAPYRSADRRLARGTVCRGEKNFLALVLDFGKSLHFGMFRFRASLGRTKGKTSRRGALVPLLGTSLPCHTAMSFQNRSRGATWRRLHQSRRFRRMCHKRSFQKCRTFDINKCRLQTACETWGVAPSRHTSRRAWHARSWRPITMGRSARREHAVAEASFGRYLKPVRPRFVQIKTHRRRVEHKCSMPSATESRVKRGPAIPQT